MRFSTIYSTIFLASVFSLAFPTTTAANDMRRWTDASGNYTVEAELLTVNKQLVVLERQDGELIALRRDELSDSDTDFVRRHELANQEDENLDGDFIWKLRDGEEIAGRLVGFGRQELIVKRERGKIWVNDRQLDELPKAYRKILPNVVSAIDEAKITSVSELEMHLADLGAGPFKYTVEGVQLDLRERGMITIPLSLLTLQESQQIAPGFMRWQASQEAEVSEDDRYETESRERLALDSRLRQRARARYQSTGQLQQMKMMELGLLAVQAGVTDVWEVAIRPMNRYGYGRTVMVSAQNSIIARQKVAQRYPGWEIGVIAKRSY